jgi:hypothetical protein
MPTVFITSPSRVAVCGDSSDGLTTTVLPQARAGPTFQVINMKGAFHGQTTPITPLGRRSV